jgi:hypothetical protein
MYHTTSALVQLRLVPFLYFRGLFLCMQLLVVLLNRQALH